MNYFYVCILNNASTKLSKVSPGIGDDRWRVYHLGIYPVPLSLAIPQWVGAMSTAMSTGDGFGHLWEETLPLKLRLVTNFVGQSSRYLFRPLSLAVPPWVGARRCHLCEQMAPLKLRPRATSVVSEILPLIVAHVRCSVFACSIPRTQMRTSVWVTDSNTNSVTSTSNWGAKHWVYLLNLFTYFGWLQNFVCLVCCVTVQDWWSTTLLGRSHHADWLMTTITCTHKFA